MICNATIRNARIFIEDHGILTWMLDLDYGSSGQGFGGYWLKPHHIRGVLDVIGVSDWQDLIGKNCRSDCENARVHRIGHTTADRWFDPSDTADAGKVDVTG